MNIGVLSGKGGTGKTTVATNIAMLMKATYMDCDVEEPNGFIFLKPEITESHKTYVKYPTIDQEKCTLCGKCSDRCQFNALSTGNKDVIVFSNLCHSCGVCKLVCQNDAISYKQREAGTIESGKNQLINCMQGILNIGEPMAVPVIRDLLKDLEPTINIIDCSPGTSCNVVVTLRHIDKAILVTEPSQLGLHDLKITVDLLKELKIPFGVIVNKAQDQYQLIDNYCKSEKILILGKIPYDKKIATIYSKGCLIFDKDEYKQIFKNIKDNLEEKLLWS